MRPFYEKLGPDGGASFLCRAFAGRAFDCPFHFHPECELTHIVASRGLRFTGDHIGEFGPGDLVLFGPDLPHSYHNDPGARSGPTGARSQVVQFRPDCLGGILQKAPELRPVRRLLERAGRGLRFTGAARSRTLARLDALFAAPPARRVPLLLEILVGLAGAARAEPRASRGYAPARLAESDERIGRVCAHINRHFAEPLYLERVAALAHLTPAAFCRFFRRTTGRTFTAFVNEVRLSQAARLLQETTLGVTDICFRSGYGNVAHFNRHFRRHHGLPPRAYRQRQHAASSSRRPPRFVAVNPTA
ncbi:MAG TPA: AraC family transcriptional regulator [Opitutus sp.]|nr:AraC family transcriptional regulator [Opitutus sp.]